MSEPFAHIIVVSFMLLYFIPKIGEMACFYPNPNIILNYFRNMLVGLVMMIIGVLLMAPLALLAWAMTVVTNA